LYGLLAHHFDCAEQVEKAVHYLIAAGDKARLDDALEEAARFYRRAVERLEAAGDAEGASGVWLKLALVHQADFDFAAAHEAYERGFAWGQRTSRRPRRSSEELVVLRHSGSFLWTAWIRDGYSPWRMEHGSATLRRMATGGRRFETL